MTKSTADKIAKRADEALRRALNTPPKPHKNMKKGKGKKRQNDRPTASDVSHDRPARK
jgi:hypothetical protein